MTHYRREGGCFVDNNWLDLLQNTTQLPEVLETNRYTERFGLTVSEQDAQRILENRKRTLQEQRRVEFGPGCVTKLMYEFCDSAYIDQNNYVDTIIRLQDIFYLYKNEMNDEMTDDELIHLMKEQYEKLCFGDPDYLESTCLAEFAQAVRAGYRGFRETDGHGAYSAFDRQERWNHELYEETLRNL